MTVRIKTPGGEVSYQIPVMKTQQYTLDELFEKKLLFLIPFYIFTHESRFREYEENADKREVLRSEASKIMEKLEQMAIKGDISEYVKCTVVDMTRKVVEKITAKYENVWKDVTFVMGGKVLEHEAKSILKDGLRLHIQKEKKLDVLTMYLKKASHVQSIEEFEEWLRREEKSFCSKCPKT